MLQNPPPPSEADESPETMASVVYRKLRGDILTGKLKPGGKLRIESLTELYGVGASPTREALNRLSAESFVKRLDQRGFLVAPVSMKELIELTRTRCLLNEITLREAIKQGDTAWEDRIIIAGNRLKRTDRLGEDGKVNLLWEERHKKFHLALIDACDSRWLIEQTESLFDCADRYRHLALKAGGQNRDAVDEHQTVMEAVLDRNADLAVRLLNEHIAATAEIISSFPLDLISSDEPCDVTVAAPAKARRKRAAKSVFVR